MKIVKLKKIKHDYKRGHKAPNKMPTVTESCELWEDDELVGVYLNKARPYAPMLTRVMQIANKEFRSQNVPKTMLARAAALTAQSDGLSKKQSKAAHSQFSTILGSVPPKAIFKRTSPTISSVHSEPKAKNFIKAMLTASKVLDGILECFMPDQHKQQTELLERVPKKWKFGTLFTSSISNYNIAANCHIDNPNIRGTCNAIYTKRSQASGGSLFLPDYDVVFEQPDDSLLIYPAWRNLHAVTAIEKHSEDGYRNSFIWYALKAFLDLKE